MKTELLRYVFCPLCKGKLNFSQRSPAVGDLIQSGLIECLECKEIYPVIGSVPIFLSKNRIWNFVKNQHHQDELRRLGLENCNATIDDAELIKTRSSSQWGLQRQKDSYTTGESDTFSKRFFLEELQTTEEALRGKVILDACCGGGRGLRFSKELGEIVIGVDISETIFQIAEIFKDETETNLYLICGDVCALPFKDGFFDVAYSQRALHHLPDFDEGLKEVARTVKTGGKLSFSVYSHENNGLMINVVEPFRHTIDAIFGVSGIMVVSFIISVIVHPFIKLYALILKQKEPKFVFHRLLLHWASLDFSRFKKNIVFDLLHAPKARYISRNEITEYLASNGLQQQGMYLQHGTVWCVNTHKVNAGQSL